MQILSCFTSRYWFSDFSFEFSRRNVSPIVSTRVSNLRVLRWMLQVRDVREKWFFSKTVIKWLNLTFLFFHVFSGVASFVVKHVRSAFFFFGWKPFLAIFLRVLRWSKRSVFCNDLKSEDLLVNIDGPWGFFNDFGPFWTRSRNPFCPFWTPRGPIWPVIYESKIYFAYTSRLICYLLRRVIFEAHFGGTAPSKMQILNFVRSCPFFLVAFAQKLGFWSRGVTVTFWIHREIHGFRESWSRKWAFRSRGLIFFFFSQKVANRLQTSKVFACNVE